MRISPPLAVLTVTVAVVAIAVWLAPPNRGPSQAPPASTSAPNPSSG